MHAGVNLCLVREYHALGQLTEFSERNPFSKYNA